MQTAASATKWLAFRELRVCTPGCSVEGCLPAPMSDDDLFLLEPSGMRASQKGTGAGASLKMRNCRIRLGQ